MRGDISEDCLYLNIWTPAQRASERRAVFVYMHGGGYKEGSATVPVYDGEGLASKGLVVVTFNYRLGVLGFLAHPELTREAPYHASGNYGLLDKIAVLRWVRENITAFGGDPNRVTIAGQSAGAQDVHHLTASPLAKALFQRAIIQSGSNLGMLTIGGRAMAAHEADGVRFATAKGVSSLAALRALTWQSIAAADPSAPGGGAPVIDGYVLPQSVGQAFAEGTQNDVPTLTGWNAHEFGTSPNPGTTVEDVRGRVSARWGGEADELLRVLQTPEQAAAVYIEMAQADRRVSMYRWATTRGKTSKTPAFTYFWNHTIPGPGAALYGAFHTAEVPYVLNNLRKSPRPFTEADHRLAELVSSYWVNFANTGDPNGATVPHWPAVNEDQAETMQLGNETSVIGAAATPAKVLSAIRNLPK